MSSRGKKKMKKKPTPQLTLTLMSLPDDLLLICLARVSRLCYPTLSLVSKRIRSLLASPELYKARSISGHTETCLYVCMSDYSNLVLFTLCRRKPDQESATGYFLARVPIPGCSRLVGFSNLVAIGSDIYKIGGSYHDPPSSSVSILDCKSHTWREGPRLPVELAPLTASVIDQKIYVAGYDSEMNSNSFHVLDTTRQIWDPESIPCGLAKHKFSYPLRSACVDGKFHVTNFIEKVVYNPKERRWDFERGGVDSYLFCNSYCDIGNVLYCFWYGKFIWYDNEVRYWRDLKGLEVGLRKIPNDNNKTCVKLAECGGKMAVLWKERCSPTRDNMIWCAEIALERRNSCEIWGKVEWCGNVLQPVPQLFDLVKVLSVTV